MAKRILVFAYGAASYLAFFATFLYLMGFVSGFIVPKSIDSAPEGPLGEAMLVNFSLIALFGLQHSIMARRWFKRGMTQVVPEPVERATFVLATVVVLNLLFWQWRPMGGVLWNVSEPALRTALLVISLMGWLLVLTATFLINHFDLFGLRQVYLYLRGVPYTQIAFRQPWLYRQVRHPLYLGFLIAFWVAPTMTMAHFFFAVVITSYILMAIQFEEHDLVEQHGHAYLEYRKRVGMLIPKSSS